MLHVINCILVFGSAWPLSDLKNHMDMINADMANYNSGVSDYKAGNHLWIINDTRNHFPLIQPGLRLLYRYIIVGTLLVRVVHIIHWKYKCGKNS